MKNHYQKEYGLITWLIVRDCYRRFITLIFLLRYLYSVWAPVGCMIFSIRLQGLFLNMPGLEAEVTCQLMAQVW